MILYRIKRRFKRFVSSVTGKFMSRKDAANNPTAYEREFEVKEEVTV